METTWVIHVADASALGTPPALMSNADDNAIVSGSLSFGAGQTICTFTVETIDDTRTEPTETYQVVVSPPVGSVGGNDASGTGTITDNDQPKPTITIKDVKVPEGNTAVLPSRFPGRRLPP